MGVSLHKKIIRGHPYWYARECQRVAGRPKIVWQKYLGKAEAIATAMGAPAQPGPPTAIDLCAFAGPAALYALTQQLDLVATIDRHASKRTQGVSVGTYITLAALNRCLAPTSKARFVEWYQATVLRRLLPVAPGQLTSQRFWDHMSYLDADQLSAIEVDLTRTLIDRFGLDLSCLLYDTINFYTFIDSFNEAPSLAQRGKSKEKRTDLRLVGLALLVTQDFHIPPLPPRLPRQHPRRPDLRVRHGDARRRDVCDARRTTSAPPFRIARVCPGEATRRESLLLGRPGDHALAPEECPRQIPHLLKWTFEAKQHRLV